MAYCNTIVEHSAQLDSGFPRRKTLLRSMRQLFVRANDLAASRQHFADTVCKIRRAGASALCCPRKVWCGRRDLNPHGPFKPCGFSYRLRLSPPGREALAELTLVCGLDYPFTFLRKNPKLRCCPSSLYTFPAGIHNRDWLGIAI